MLDLTSKVHKKGEKNETRRQPSSTELHGKELKKIEGRKKERKEEGRRFKNKI